MPPFRLAFVLTAALAVLAVPRVALADDLTVVITAPATGSVVAGVVDLDAATTGAVTSVAFAWSDDGGTSWTAIGTDATPVDGWSRSWDTGTFSGAARVRATATDGTVSSWDEIALQVDNVAPVVGLSLTRPAFSPNGDGVKDRTTAVVTLSERASLTLTVRNTAGVVVKTLSVGAEMAAGTHRFEWRGLVKDGSSWVRAADGVYRVVATAVDEAANADTVVRLLVLDTKAPGFVWRSISPEPLYGTGSIDLRFLATDALSARLAVSFTVLDQLGPVRTVSGLSRLRGERTVAWLPRYPSGGVLIPGPYRVRVTLVDAAGNRKVSADRVFRVHRPVTTKVYRRVEGSGNRVALTFDDCIYGDAWDRILDILAARGAKASFFCNGVHVSRFPGLADRTAAAGHTVGSHTSDHAFLPPLTYGGVRARILADQAAWWAAAGWSPSPYFRPPYGAYDAEVLSAAGDAGFLRTVLWDVDPTDWSNPGAAAIASRVVGASRAGSIVVLHVQPQTADALNAIITGLRARGLEPVSLARLFRAAGLH